MTEAKGLSPAEFQILLALVDGVEHARGIKMDVRQRTEGQVDMGQRPLPTEASPEALGFECWCGHLFLHVCPTVGEPSAGLPPGFTWIRTAE